MRRRGFRNSGSGFTFGKLIMFVLALILVAACIAAAVFYNQVMGDKRKGYAAGENIAVREAELQHVNKVERYDGEKSYIIVQGRNKDNLGKFVFVPMAKKEKPVIIDSGGIIAEGEMKRQWQRTCSTCQFVNVSAAMIAEEPLWEITYKDESGHFAYDYFAMEDGTAVEQFRLSNNTD